MTDKLPATNGEAKTRTPRNNESITKGALALDLNDRVALCKALKTSIENEVTALKTQAENATKAAENL